MPKKKKITHTRKYLRGLTICLRPQSCRDFTIIREKNTSVVVQFVFSLKNYIKKNPNHQNNSFYILRTGFTMGYKTGQKFFPGASQELRLRPMD